MSAAIAVRDIPNKGRGYIAQRDIKVGEIILEEQPLKSKKFQGHDELAYILASNKELSDLLQFDESQGQDKRSKALAQVKLNSFLARDPTSNDSDTYMLQLDPKGSFFNHSCFPNAASHLKSSGTTITIALSPIASGEEICYKTEVLFLPTTRRRQLLQDNWGFNCTCGRCEKALPNDALLMQGNMTANEAKSIHNNLTLEIYNDIENNKKVLLTNREMSEDYDKLLKTKDLINDYPDAEKWVDQAKEFLYLDLHKAHWRKITIRKWIIHFLLNPHFPPKLVNKYVREQIEVYKLFAPNLHNCKLELFLTFRDICGAGWEDQLMKLDENSKTILQWFGSDKL